MQRLLGLRRMQACKARHPRNPLVDLQSAIALLKREVTELPLGFDNFRD